MDAIRAGDAETVRIILEDGLNPDLRYNDTSFIYEDTDDTLLHWAAQFDSTASAEVALLAVISVSQRSRVLDCPGSH